VIKRIRLIERADNMSESELLAELHILQSREGKVREQRRLEQIICIYKQLVDLCPKNLIYKQGMAAILMRHGNDEKLIHLNFTKAREIFLEILEVDPHNVEAFYRLGHVYSELYQWDKARHTLQRVLNYELPTIKRVRALCTLAKSSFHLSQVNDAMTYLKMAKAEDIDRDCTYDIIQIERMMRNQDKEFIVTDMEESTFISEEEVDEFNEDNKEIEKKLILELSNRYPTLIFQNKDADLERMQVNVLRYLFDNRGQFLSEEQIHHHVWNDEVDIEIVKNRVKNVISELRNALRQLQLDESVKDLIVNRRNMGYSWQGAYKIMIIERNPYFDIRLSRR
jgi:DNA-binding winged helix-turn-helix (wHTH) protein